jgi:hypothetical protein
VRLNAFAIACFVTLGLCVGGAESQQPTPLPTCPAEQARAFSFLVGRFRGVVYDLSNTDSAFTGVTARVSVERVVTGCALLERWHFDQNGATEDDVVVLRAFDARSGKWSYDIANAHLDLIDGEWYFGHDFVNDGRTVRVRIKWVPTARGYTEQVSRSRDSGATWVNTRHINFAREGD